MKMIICAGSLALAPLAGGGELQTDWVSADADWIVHIDMEGLSRSALGNLLLSCGGGDVRDGLGEFEAETGLDLQEDVLSVTAYGTIDSIHKDRVLLAVTTTRVDEAIARLTAHPELAVTTMTIDGYEVHVLSGEDGTIYLHRRPFNEFDERRVVVLADDRYVLLSALEVMEGKVGHHEALEEGPRPGSLIFATVEEMQSLRGLDPAVKFIRLSEGFAIDVGETDEMIHADAVVTAGSPSDASNIAQVVQGFAALGRLAIDQEPQLAPLRPLLQGLTATAVDSRLTVQVRVDIQALEGPPSEPPSEEHEE